MMIHLQMKNNTKHDQLRQIKKSQKTYQRNFIINKNSEHRSPKYSNSNFPRPNKRLELSK